MLVLGGVGRLYARSSAPPLYLVARDYLARQTPEYWYLGMEFCS